MPTQTNVTFKSVKISVTLYQTTHIYHLENRSEERENTEFLQIPSLKIALLFNMHAISRWFRGYSLFYFGCLHTNVPYIFIRGNTNLFTFHTPSKQYYFPILTDIYIIIFFREKRSFHPQAQAILPTPCFSPRQCYPLQSCPFQCPTLTS